jgi:hypothetical protein
MNWRATNAPAAVALSDASGITGYAWGDELGWINFTPSSGGLNLNPNTGAVVGMAWSATTGWINFAPTNGGVSINTNGEFTGWAWASGAYGGWIKFNCGDPNACVKTDWVPISARGGGGGGGGGGGIVNPELIYNPGPANPPGAPTTEKSLIDKILDKITGLFRPGTPLTTPQILTFGRQKTNVPIIKVTQTLRLNTNELMCKEPLYPCPYFTKYQQEGDTGGDVLRIQRFLNTIYKNNQIKMTGTFDVATTNLIKRFQKEYSKTTLSVYGLVEPTGAWYQATRRAANEFVGCYDPVLQLETPSFTHQE